MKIKLHIFALILATAAALCFPQILNLKDNVLGYTNSIFSVMLWLLCYYAVNRALHTIDLTDRRAFVLAGVLSFLFTVAILFGTRLDHVENVDFKDGLLWISLPVFTCLFTILVCKLWDFLSRLEEKRRVLAEQLGTPVLPQMRSTYRNILVFCILFLCWFVVLLAVYPGFFVYDAQDEYLQVASRNFTTHHPLLHVLMLGGMICGVHKFTGSYNLGIACYTIFQMLVIAGVFTYVIAYLRKKGVSLWIRLFALLYFAAFPVVVMFTLCSSKDAFFTAALLLLLIALLEMGCREEEFFTSFRWQIFFVGSAVSMMLFRKNGVYAFLVLIPCLLVLQVRHRNKKYFKKLGCLLGISLAGFLVINGGMQVALHAQAGENQEILTVPIQQLARTYKYTPEAFSKEDRELLLKVLPEDVLARYNPRLSDPVKYYFNNREYEKNKMQYVKLWARVGLRKPVSYLNAWLMTSYGFWYPDTVINVYAGNSVFTFTYKDCSYFGYEVEEPGVRASKIPWLNEAYRKLSLEIQQEKIPVWSMLFSPGCLFWCFAFSLSYLLYRRKYHILSAYLPVLLVWLTVILGPTYLPRYVLIFWYGLPLFMSVLLCEERFGCKNKGSVLY